MALTRWEPFGGLTSLRHEMDRLFEHVLGREPSPLGEAEPAIEVADTPEAVIVKAQVPGVSKENLQVTVTENALTLKGEVKIPAASGGAFRRKLSVMLGESVPQTP